MSNRVVLANASLVQRDLAAAAAAERCADLGAAAAAGKEVKAVAVAGRAERAAAARVQRVVTSTALNAADAPSPMTCQTLALQEKGVTPETLKPAHVLFAVSRRCALKREAAKHTFFVQ